MKSKEKMILIVDKPKDCDDCFGTAYGEYGCPLADNWSWTTPNCPLKPLPQKKILDEELFMSGNFRLIQARFTGWNDCIDEILGGE